MNSFSEKVKIANKCSLELFCSIFTSRSLEKLMGWIKPFLQIRKRQCIDFIWFYVNDIFYSKLAWESAQKRSMNFVSLHCAQFSEVDQNIKEEPLITAYIHIYAHKHVPQRLASPILLRCSFRFYSPFIYVCLCSCVFIYFGLTKAHAVLFIYLFVSVLFFFVKY